MQPRSRPVAADLARVLPVERHEDALSPLPVGAGGPRRRARGRGRPARGSWLERRTREPHEAGAVSSESGGASGGTASSSRGGATSGGPKRATPPRPRAGRPWPRSETELVVLDPGQVARGVVGEEDGAAPSARSAAAARAAWRGRGDRRSCCRSRAGSRGNPRRPPGRGGPTPRSSIARTFSRTAGESAPNGWKSKRGP